MSSDRSLPAVRQLLLVLLAASIVPMLAVALGVIGYQYWREREATDAAAIATARGLVAAVDDRFAGIQGALLALAASEQLARGDIAGFRQEALAVQAAERLAAVVLLDAGGHQVANTAVPAGQPLPAGTAPAAMLAPLRKGTPAALDLFRLSDASGLQAGLGVPVPLPGAPYVLDAVLDPASLQLLLRRQRLPSSWIVAVLDSQGRIVARTHEPERLLGTPARAALIRQIAQVREAAVESTTVDGVPVITAYSRSAGSGWSVAIGMPQRELHAPARDLLVALLGGAGLALALSAWLALRQARAISGSIEALGAAVRAVGHTGALRLPTPAFREAQQLGDAFRHAATEARDAAAAAERNAQQLRAILQSARDAIVTTDAAGRIVQFNGAAEAMFGVAAQDVLGHAVDQLVPQPWRADHGDWMRQLTDAGEVPRAMGFGRTVHAMRRDGSSFPAEVSISSAEIGEERLFTAILRDVTERERHEQALARSNLELGQFAYVASHDLRAPLKSIGGYLDLLRTRYAQPLGDGGLMLVQRARHAALRLERLMEDLLAYARLENKGRAPVPVDCQAVLGDVLQLLDEDVRATGATVRAGPLPTVRGDPGQLTQLLLNLVGNALKYRRGPPLIEIGARHAEGCWAFSVRDNGIGIEPEYLDSIFEIFKRLHTQRDYPGTGIGLALCRRIVERHGGRIWAESAPGQGSVFHFTIADPPGAVP